MSDRAEGASAAGGVRQLTAVGDATAYPAGASREAAAQGGKQVVEPSDAGRLVVLTHNLPITVRRGERGPEAGPSVGGLAKAVEPILRKRGGVWVGWVGPDLAPGDSFDLRGAPYQIAPVELSDEDLERHVQGLCDGTLWPLMHCFPSRASFCCCEWPAYRQVNWRFAAAALSLAREGDLVWIHDYQLMRAPLHLRQAAMRLRLAFFLHVPFPSHDVFRLLPHGEELLRGLLACDLVGFHVDSYARNFLDCAERLPGVRVSRERGCVEFQGRSCRVGAFPIGIDFDRFASLSESSGSPDESPRIVFDACRLDYTKGIEQRILAMERLLERQPHYREQVSLLQVVVPSVSGTEDSCALKRQVEKLVGRVNGRFGTATWSPIQYLCQQLSEEDLASLYARADVGLVTPLRDGMNVVAKEFVAARTGEPGVLVLSELAGAAETMREALLVNPYDMDATAAALDRALRMEPAERKWRMRALRARERRCDVFAWADAFLGSVPDPATPEAWPGRASRSRG